jgi:hypothetical protein
MDQTDLQTNDIGTAFCTPALFDFLGRELEVAEPWSPILRGCADQFNLIH